MTTLENTTTDPRTGPIASRPNERIDAREGEALNPSECAPYSPEPSIPTMLAPRELSYLYWLASQVQGRGRVIDLGPFLGGSTVPLAQGILASDAPEQRLLSYDGFDSPETTTPEFVHLLAGYGLTPGRCFYDRFLANIGAAGGEIAERVVARKGWVPPNADHQQRLTLYPEQEPIELLFIDLAKTWDVDLSVISTFFPHLLPGAVVVHQDFFDLQTPWIPLHMWQLRDVLEPLDVIYGTPSVSFRCVGQVAPKLNELSLAPLGKTFDAGVWDEVIAYWAGLIGKSAAAGLHGHACSMALMHDRYDDAVRHGRAFEGWSRSRNSAMMYFSPEWPSLLRSIPRRLKSVGLHNPAPFALAAESMARGSRLNRLRPGEPVHYYPLTLRREIWDSVIANLERRKKPGGVHLYGAGQHTRWLFKTYGDRLAALVECILDDDPQEGSIHGVRVRHLSELVPTPGQMLAVLPSSDSYESRMLVKLHEHFSAHASVMITPVYTSSFAYNVSQVCEYKPRAVETVGENHSRASNEVQVVVSPEAGHRPRLGLPRHRAWADDLAACYAPPLWCTGYPAVPEIEFLWDMIESERPSTVVEIGTAAGVSTAMILHALRLFCDPDARVRSYDISTKCYFEIARQVGAAIPEMAPELIDRARMFEHSDAIDAASQLGIGEIDLAFIDGNHHHPAPTLDVLAMIYAIRPGAWVVLHDIELANIEDENGHCPWRDTTGAQLLYEHWPYEKVRLESAHPNDRNMGAIRMPDDPSGAVDACLSLLRLPWEMKPQTDPSLDALLDAWARGGA